MASDHEQFRKAENEACLALIARATENLSVINTPNQYGDTPLVAAIRLSNPEQRLWHVNALLDLGADPDFRIDDGSGDALFEAVLQQDAAVLECLLSRGANPTYIVDPPESLYDWAEFDYRFEAWDLRPPIESTESDRVSEDSWLDYLDRCAEKVGVRKPIHLRRLRNFGALRRAEIETGL